MSNSGADMAQGGPFWARVRAALSGLRPARAEKAPAYGQAAIARTLGIKTRLGSRIDEALLLGWRAAGARNVSLSLMVIEIDRAGDYFNAYGKAAMDACVLEVMHALNQNAPRPGDACLRLGRAGYVMVLPDLPLLVARAAAARMAEAVRKLDLAHKESHAGAVTVSVGMAVANPVGNYDKRFFEAAAEAVKKAQRKGLGRIEAVDLRPAQDRRARAA